MVNLSPDTRVGDTGFLNGYLYGDEHIRFFSHLHAWQLCALPVMPTLGEMRGPQGSDVYKSRFSHDTETAQPGYHAVTLDDYTIDVELTATTRVGFHRYTFNKSGRAWILFDLPATISMPMSECFLRQAAFPEFRGYVENEASIRRPKRTKVFFSSRFDRAPDECVTWRDAEVRPLDGAARNCGVAFGYDVQAGDVLQLRVGLSYCGTDYAQENVAKECNHWDFDAVRNEARAEWNDWLGRIEVEGGTDAQKTKFYTDLSHALKGRRRVSDAGGTYLDMTGDLPRVRQIPLDENGCPQYDHHNSDAFWGAAWTLNTLWPLAWPRVTHNVCHTMLDMYRNDGLIPRGPSGGNYTFVMIAPTSTTFLVSAWMQQVRSFDIETAYQGLLKNHEAGGLMSKAGYEHHTCRGGGVEHYIEHGYVPQGIKARAFHTHATAAMTLEYAFHDWALAQLAKELGHPDDYDRLMARSTNYRNVWDAETRFMRPREMDGSFAADFDPMTVNGFAEGNAHHYRWHVPHDVEGLMELFGGQELFVRELDQLFTKAEAHGFVATKNRHSDSWMDYGNQPCTYLAHLFNHAGAPWLTQKWVRRVTQGVKSDITPYGGDGGDEDQGQMGALNALMAIGLFSLRGACDQEPMLELSSPIFDRITVHLDPAYHPGGTFTIETINNGPGDRYIQSAVLNGESLDQPWFPHKQFTQGGALRITLGAEPNREWGSQPQAQARKKM